MTQQIQTGTVAYPGSTKWTNPTPRVVKFKLHKGPPAVKRGAFQGAPPVVLDSGIIEVSIPPGDSVLLPSIYDDAIQTYDAEGVIQWGHAPQLIKNDSHHEMHPALDPIKQQLIDNEAKAAAAMLEKQNAETAMLIAAGKRAEAERLQHEAVEAQRTAKVAVPDVEPRRPPPKPDQHDKHDKK